MKAFITGISGFTGSHLQQYLVKQKIAVTGIDLREKTNFFSCDLRDKAKLGEILTQEKPDYIFHLASPIARSKAIIDETLVKNLEVDLFGTVNLLEAAATLTKKPRILITGTAAEYDVEIKRARRETDALKPNSSYGLSKMTQELISFRLAKSYELELIFTRTFLLVGKGQKQGFAITDWCQQINAGQTVLKTGDLDIVRDYTDIRDAVRAYWLLIQKGKAGETYNVCSGNPISLKKIVETLKEISRRNIKIDEDKKRFKNNDPDKLWGDNSKLRKLGWKQEFTLTDSLQTMLDNKL